MCTYHVEYNSQTSKGIVAEITSSDCTRITEHFKYIILIEISNYMINHIREREQLTLPHRIEKICCPNNLPFEGRWVIVLIWSRILNQRGYRAKSRSYLLAGEEIREKEWVKSIQLIDWLRVSSTFFGSISSLRPPAIINVNCMLIVIHLWILPFVLVLKSNQTNKN